MKKDSRSRSWVGRVALLAGIAAAGLAVPSCKQEARRPPGGRLGTLAIIVPPVDELTCQRRFVFAHLTWRPAALYDEIRIYRGGKLIGVVPGTFDRFTDCLLQKDQAICGYYEYDVIGVLEGQASNPASVPLSVGSIVWDPNQEPNLAGYRISFSIARLDEVFEVSPNPYHAVLDRVPTCGVPLSLLFRSAEFRERIEEAYRISRRADLAGESFEEKLESFLEGGQVYLAISAVDLEGNASAPSYSIPFRYRIESSDFSALPSPAP